MSVSAAPPAGPPAELAWNLIVEPAHTGEWDVHADQGPPDAYEPYRAGVLRTRAFDYKLGFFLAYYRSFAAPESAARLVRSGVILREPQKRSYDTAIIIMEQIIAGYDSPRGRQVTELLVRAHERVQATPEVSLYTLLSLHVVPTRWIDEHGDRPLTAEERAASFAFYLELGRRMGLADLPADEASAIEFYDAFERDVVRRTPDTVALMDATVSVLAGRMPRILRGLVRPILSSLIGDPHMCDTLGLAPPSRAFTAVVLAALRLRARVARPATRDAFVPGRSASTQYPSGYELEDLGPTTRAR